MSCTQRHKDIAIVHLKSAREAWWLNHLQTLMPEVDFRLWDTPGDPSEVLYAIVWHPPTGGLRRFPNLQCIVSVGAGIDHVLRDTQLPRHVPIIRTTGADLTQRMREYVTLHVLRHHRGLTAIESQQHNKHWHQAIHPPAYERTVGIMGLGNLGMDCALTLSAVGFDVAGWSRRAKDINGVKSFAGDQQLAAFLKRTTILVCMLPLTEATRGIVNAALLQQLPRAACVINVARGEHLVDADLIQALDREHISEATLDVFNTEPLPADHPFWDHPKVLVTPHVASMIDPESGGHTIVDNLRRFIAGDPVADMVDLKQGY